MGQPYLVQLIGSYLWDDIEDLARGMTARDARRALADGTSSAASMRRLPRPPPVSLPRPPPVSILSPPLTLPAGRRTNTTGTQRLTR